MKIKPLTLKEANNFVSLLHRHHKPVQGHRFSIGVEKEDKIIGVAIVGRPVARGCDYRKIAEVTRLCTDGTKNTCSMLYAACARICKEMGFEKIQTYILETETGHSLKVSSWEFEEITKGRQWIHTNGKPRRTDQPNCNKQRWAKKLNGS